MRGAPSHRVPSVKRAALAVLVLPVCLRPLAAPADDEAPTAPTNPPRENLVKQANAPLSDILQLRFQDAFFPSIRHVDGETNTTTLGITMPLPAYRLLPFPQLSLLTIPAVVKPPNASVGFGDLRFVDVAILDAGHKVLFGIGPTFVFPSASRPETGQGKWQVGPAAAIAYSPEQWLVGVLAQNPISFGGDPHRRDANALFLQPFVTYQLGGGWFIRSQPQIAVDWKTGNHVVPLDLGAGRVFRLGRRYVNLFVEPFYTVSTTGPQPVWGVTIGGAFLYPNFWRGD